MTAASILTALLVARLPRLRRDMAARGVPAAEQDRMIAALRHRTAEDAAELIKASAALRALAKPASMGPLPARRAIVGVFFKGLPVRVLVAGTASGESAMRRASGAGRGFYLDPAVGGPRDDGDLVRFRARAAWAQPLAMVIR